MSVADDALDTSDRTAREVQVAAKLATAVKEHSGATWSLQAPAGGPCGLPLSGWLVSMPGRSLTLRGYEESGRLAEIVGAWLVLHRDLLQGGAVVDALDDLIGRAVGGTSAASLGSVFAGGWWDSSRGTTVFDVNVLITEGVRADGVADGGRHLALNAGWHWGEHSVWRIDPDLPNGGEEVLC